jgi:hypothetical protein
MYVQRSILLATVSAAALFAGSAAQATTLTYSGSGGCSEACSATATVTTGAGNVTVVLTDTQANPASAGDLLSNFHIALPGSPTGLTQAGTLITVASTTGPYATTAGPPTHWEVSTSGGVITLDTFSGSAPINMIIGPPNSSGNYTGNASVTDGHFSPYINGTGTFVFSDTSITAGTLLPTSVVFTFGTMLNETQITGHVVPLPPAALLFGTALVGMGILGRRRRNNGGVQAWTELSPGTGVWS